MDKRFQVFVSSTFTDLIEERQHALKAILELGHMPAGMELFPAGDDEAWDLIQDEVENSDYYVLIIGGRYGSQDPAGIGFTEKEYDYATAKKKRVIALLHKNPTDLPRSKTETDDEAWRKLSAFRSKVEKKHTCVYWANGDELKSKLILSLMSEIRRHPSGGWVRADEVPSDDVLADLLQMQRRVAELEGQLASARTTAPSGTESLQQGEDEFDVSTWFNTYDVKIHSFAAPRTQHAVRVSSTWNEVFAAVAPTMIVEASDQALKRALRSYYADQCRDLVAGLPKFADLVVEDIEVSREDIDTCVVQFRALGLIQESQRKRSVKDAGTYWSLTPYGDTRMVQLRALRRGDKPPGSDGGSVDPTK